MTHYAVSDVQGHCDCLERLLDQVRFDPAVDQIWFCGDLVNKGPDSAGVLRLVRSLGPQAKTVLGNHDLRLLALAEGCTVQGDTTDLEGVLDAADAADLIEWLFQQPFVLQDAESKRIMTHAGIPPQWTIPQVLDYAEQLNINLNDAELRTNLIEEVIAPETVSELQPENSGNHLRYALNAFTLMRFCSANGRLNLIDKMPSADLPTACKPWFEWPRNSDYLYLFGHWSTLNGITGNPQFIALDTGIASAGELSLVNLETAITLACSPDGDIRFRLNPAARRTVHRTAADG